MSTASLEDLARKARRRAFIVIAIGILLVIIPLGASSIRVFKQNQIRREAIPLAQEWIEGTGYGISKIDVNGDQVDLVIYGSGERPQLCKLGDQLAGSIDQTFNIKLVVVPSEQEEYPTVSE